MPVMANLSSKKFDNVTIVTLEAIQPSAGEQPAIWRAINGASSQAFRPQLTYSFKKNGAGTAIRVNAKYSAPQTYTDTATGLTKVANTAIFELTGVVPMSMPEADVKDALAVFAASLLPAAGTLSLAVATGTGVI